MDNLGEPIGETQAVQVPAGSVTLTAELSIPVRARGIIVFAHGSESSLHSSRNRFVAQQLHDAGLATLLVDLLVAGEAQADLPASEQRFDVELLAERFVAATDWLMQLPATQNLPIGYYGASTGAGVALAAAAERPDLVFALVSRGGRPDLAERVLPRVRMPTLLIIGGNDFPIIGFNRDALMHLGGERSLEIVPGATHLFEEPGALEWVAQLTREWFLRYLGASRQQTVGK